MSTHASCREWSRSGALRQCRAAGCRRSTTSCRRTSASRQQPPRAATGVQERRWLRWPTDHTGAAAMLTVHNLRRSQSERIVWLCEELGLTYALRCYDRDQTDLLAPPAYKALHPMGIAPVIEDDGMVL